MRKFVLSIFVILLLSVNIMAQNQRVSGTVTTEDGSAIAGVTVVIKNTNEGTITNAAGKYSINVPKNATLHFSFVGMESQEVAVGSQSAINIKLMSASAMIDDINVVHVAFGTAKKEAFTGSAAVINAAQLAKTQTSNISQALAGAVPGLQITNASGKPGATASIRIRGIGSYGASSLPLFVVDGVPYDGALENLNPSDIESMTVLKDAASSALYGSRGANGVIMITTKRGKSMDAVVNVDAKWGVNSRALKEYDVITDPGEYYEAHYRALHNYAMNVGGKNSAEANIWANNNMIDGDAGLGYNVYNTKGGDLIGLNGKLNPNATLGNLVGDNYLYPDNWAGEAFNNSLRQEYNINISGATEKSNNYFSLGYLNDKGYVIASDFKRLSARIRSDYQVKSWLKVGASAGYSNSKGNSVGELDGSSGNLFYLARYIAPIYPLYVRDSKGNIMQGEGGIPSYDFGSEEQSGLSRPKFPASNPIAANQLDEDSFDANTLNAKGFAEVTFLKDFKATINAGLDITESRATTSTNPYYGQYAGSNGMINKKHTRSTGLNLQQLLTYAKSIHNHNFDILVGHENYTKDYAYLSGGKSNMFLYDIKELATAIVNPSADSYTTTYNTEGYLGRVQYNYDNKYFFSASFRRDASSRFHPDNRWGNFWSVGGAWLINKENFMQSAEWVDLLKLKASYGVQGNDGIPEYSYIDQYSIVNSAGSIAAVFASKGNKNIKWETNRNFNIGVEFGLLGNRITGSVEYFSRKTDDLLFNRPVPPAIGYSSYPDNIGSIRNRGFEVDVTGVLLQKKNLLWTLSLNATHYRNKILSLPPERQGGFETGLYKVTIGGSRYDWFMQEYAGVSDKGESMWYMDELDANKKPTGKRVTTTDYSKTTKYFQGSALPDLFGGISTSLQFYGVDFSVNIAYQIGGKVYDSAYASLMDTAEPGNIGTAWHKDIWKSWSPENKSDTPRLQYGDSYAASSSSRFLISASFINIQNISLGYTLPKTWLAKVGINSVRVFAVADNVSLWSKRQGLDPRQSWDGSTRGEAYSPIRTISGGISFSF